MSSVSLMAMLQSFLIAFCMTVLIVGLRRLLVNQKKLASLRRELKEYEKLIKKAMRTKDEKTRAKVERKLKKRMGRYQQLMKELSWETTKPMFVMFLSFFIIMFVLVPVFNPMFGIVAYFPIGAIPLNFLWWYVLCSMAIGTLIQRAIGVRLSE